MKIAITGASGLVGQATEGELRAAGHEVVALGRRADVSEPSWTVEGGLRPADGLAGLDALVHLAGAGVAERRWTARRKAEIRDSRVLGTRRIVEGLAQAGDRRPRILIAASAQGFYGYDAERCFEETDGPGRGFLAEVVQAWEHEARAAEALGVRVVMLRIGVVLSTRGGALAKLLPVFRWGVGGPVGSGRQWMSWIHVADLARLIRFSLEQPALDGPVNAVGPHAVRNREFSRALARALRRPCALWVPGPALRLVLGELAEIVLEGTWVRPTAALRAGFAFVHDQLEPALADLIETGR